MRSSKIGEIVRIIWNDKTGKLQVVMEITNTEYKERLLRTKEFQDIIDFIGQDVMVVASKSRK